MGTIHRLTCCALAVVCALLLVACGGDDDDQRGAAPGSTVSTATPAPIATPELPTIDGYLISASEKKVVLQAADGEQTFEVDEQDAPQIRTDRLRERAGDTTVGFRVFYAERGGRRVIKKAQPIPRPPFEPPDSAISPG